MYFRNHSLVRALSTVIAAAISLIGGLTFVDRAEAKTASNEPDILVLVFAGEGGLDTVGLTYPNAVPHAQAKSDVKALAAIAGWNPQHLNIQDAPPPFRGSKELMTSVDFVAQDVIPVAGKYLPLEPVVLALRNYPHVAITYMVGPNYDFEGLRTYSDRYVSINLDAHGAAYTYHIYVHDPNFQQLNLPRFQLPPGQEQTADAPAPRPRVQPWQIVTITLIACLAGASVYFLMSRKATAS